MASATASSRLGGKNQSRIPPGGRANIVLGDTFSAAVETSMRKDHNNSNWAPSFDQSLHRSRTFQSTLFGNEVQVPTSSAPTKAAKRIITSSNNMSAVINLENKAPSNANGNQSPRPAKKASAVVDRTLMQDILKPKSRNVE